MFKTLRVAGLAAAAFLCPLSSASAAQVVKASEVTDAATPARPALPTAPSATATPAVITTITPAAETAATPDMTIPGRARPDRFGAEAPAAAPTPGTGVTGVATVRRSLADLVAEHSDAAVVDEEFECLASAVYFESRGEPLEGQLAVAEVILNRMRSGRFRSTICDVVKQPSQFSFVRRGVIPQAPRHSAAWARSVAIAHIALNNLADATGDESLFFHATYVNPRWGRPRIARIGNHIFYR